MTYTPDYIRNTEAPIDNIFQATTKMNTNFEGIAGEMSTVLEDVSGVLEELGTYDGRISALELEANPILTIAFTNATSSPLIIGEQPANSVIDRIVIEVTISGIYRVAYIINRDRSRY